MELEKMIEKIKLKALEQTWLEREQDLSDLAGGNIDDAYSVGVDTGEIYFARDLLKLLEAQND